MGLLIHLTENLNSSTWHICISNMLWAWSGLEGVVETPDIVKVTRNHSFIHEHLIDVILILPINFMVGFGFREKLRNLFKFFTLGDIFMRKV